MKVKSYEELIKIANNCKTSLEKLKVLQEYFIDNVEYNYIYDIAQDMKNNEKEVKTSFSSLEEKKDELQKFEKQFGDNFHFSKEDEEKILSILGEKIEPSEKIMKVNGIERKLNFKGYNGGVIDCLKRISFSETIFEEGLIKKGMCQDYSKFTKDFCDKLNIKCDILGISGHVFNLVEIDGDKRIFDYTRMIGIRDNYINPNNQKIDDWFNMTFDKMFELKPDRKIININNEMLKEPITKLNYKSVLKKEKEDFER